MPTYLFTFHAYGSWLPDRPQGYVQRDKGVLPPDPEKAKQYRQRMTHEPVLFQRDHQRLMIETTIQACGHIDCTLHAIGSDPTHFHLLVSWQDGRPWGKRQASIRQALTRRLNQQYDRRPWLSEDASHKVVKDRAHYDYLCDGYLPAHRGLKWSAQKGIYP